MRQPSRQVHQPARTQIDGTSVGSDAQVPVEHLQQHGYGSGVLGQDLAGVERKEHYSRTLGLEDGPGDGRLRLDLDEARDVGQVVHSRLRYGPGQSSFGHDVALLDKRCATRETATDERHAPELPRRPMSPPWQVDVIQVEPQLHACHGPPSLLLTSWRPGRPDSQSTGEKELQVSSRPSFERRLR